MFGDTGCSTISGAGTMVGGDVGCRHRCTTRGRGSSSHNSVPIAVYNDGLAALSSLSLSFTASAVATPGASPALILESCQVLVVCTCAGAA